MQIVCRVDMIIYFWHHSYRIYTFDIIIIIIILLLSTSRPITFLTRSILNMSRDTMSTDEMIYRFITISLTFAFELKSMQLFSYIRYEVKEMKTLSWGNNFFFDSLKLSPMEKRMEKHASYPYILTTTISLDYM